MPSNQPRRHRLRIAAAAIAALVLAALTFLPTGPATAAETASPAATDPAPPAGKAWKELHLFLDTNHSLFSSDGCNDKPFLQAPSGGCGGTYASATTTAPFNGGSGTVTWTGFLADRPIGVSFFVSGAYFAGLTPYSGPDHGRILTVTEGRAPWATSMATGTTPGVAAGEKGGPLIMGATPGDPSNPENGYYFDVRGWLLVPAALGGGSPTTTTTTEPVDSSTSTELVASTTTEPSDGTGGVTTPRFTG